MMNQVDRRRVKRVRVGFTLFQGFVVGNLANCRGPSMKTTAPLDLMVYAVTGIHPGEVGGGHLELLVWSATFDPVPEGELIPELEVVMGPEVGAVNCPICGREMGPIESERYDGNGVPLPAWMCSGEHDRDAVEFHD